MVRRSMIVQRLCSLVFGASLLGLAGCTGGSTHEGETAAASRGYPDIAEVPPRPHLGYTVEQRREIGNALLADRENARYERDQLLYETGRSLVPPQHETPQQLPMPAAVETKQEAPPAPSATRYVEERVLEETDDGSLGDFMDKLLRQRSSVEAADEAMSATPPPPEAPAATAAGTPEEPAAAPARKADGKPPARRTEEGPRPLDRILSFFGVPVGGGDATSEGSAEEPKPDREAAEEPSPADDAEAPPQPRALTGMAVAPTRTAPPQAAALEPASAALPSAVLAGQDPALTLAYGPAEVDVPPAQREALAALAASDASRKQGLSVIGHGATPAEALERARRAARALLQAGVPGDRLAIRAAGPGAEVLVFVRPQAPS
jgi:hypothetical protein